MGSLFLVGVGDLARSLVFMGSLFLVGVGGISCLVSMYMGTWVVVGLVPSIDESSPHSF